MPLYTAQDLRETVVTPLARLVSEYSESLARLEKMCDDGKIPDNRLPLRAVQAETAIAILKSVRRELVAKLEQAEDGILAVLERKRIATAQKRTAEKTATDKAVSRKPHGRKIATDS